MKMAVYNSEPISSLTVFTNKNFLIKNYARKHYEKHFRPYPTSCITYDEEISRNRFRISFVHAVYKKDPS